LLAATFRDGWARVGRRVN